MSEPARMPATGAPATLVTTAATPTSRAEPLHEHIYIDLMSLLINNTNVPALPTRNHQVWTMAGNITSVARTYFGPDTEPKHVSIRAVNIRTPNHVQRRAQIVLHRGGVDGDKLLFDAACGGEVNLFTVLVLEVERVCYQAMEGLRVKERMEAETMAEVIRGEEF